MSSIRMRPDGYGLYRSVRSNRGAIDAGAEVLYDTRANGLGKQELKDLISSSKYAIEADVVSFIDDMDEDRYAGDTIQCKAVRSRKMVYRSAQGGIQLPLSKGCLIEGIYKSLTFKREVVDRFTLHVDVAVEIDENESYSEASLCAATSADESYSLIDTDDGFYYKAISASGYNNKIVSIDEGRYFSFYNGYKAVGEEHRIGFDDSVVNSELLYEKYGYGAQNNNGLTYDIPVRCRVDAFNELISDASFPVTLDVGMVSGNGYGKYEDPIQWVKDRVVQSHGSVVSTVDALPTIVSDVVEAGNGTFKITMGGYYVCSDVEVVRDDNPYLGELDTRVRFLEPDTEDAQGWMQEAVNRQSSGQLDFIFTRASSDDSGQSISVVCRVIDHRIYRTSVLLTLGGSLLSDLDYGQQGDIVITLSASLVGGDVAKIMADDSEVGTLSRTCSELTIRYGEIRGKSLSIITDNVTGMDVSVVASYGDCVARYI